MNNSKDDVEMSDANDEVETDNDVIKRLQKSLKRSRSSSTESNESRSVETEEMRKSVNVETLISPFLSDESFTEEGGLGGPVGVASPCIRAV